MNKQESEVGQIIEVTTTRVPLEYCRHCFTDGPVRKNTNLPNE